MVVHNNLDPVLLQAGPLALDWMGLATTLALLLGLLLGLRAARRRGLPLAASSDAGLWALAGGLLGGRLLDALDHADFYHAAPATLLTTWDGGISLYGSLLGGTLALLLAARRLGLPAGRLLDSAAPAAIAAVAVGRLGCLVAGGDWGNPSGAAWGIVYWSPHAILPPALLGVPLHPYVLYQALGLALLLLVRLPLSRAVVLPDGELFGVAAGGYAALDLLLAPFHPAQPVEIALQATQIGVLLLAALRPVLQRERTSVFLRSSSHAD